MAFRQTNETKLTTQTESGHEMSTETSKLTASLVAIEHVSSKPLDGYDPTYCSLFKRAVDFVPIINIFGTTHAGTKVCMHIHHVMPYILIDMPTDIPKQFELPFLQDLCSALEASMSKALENQKFTKQFIHDARIVRGTPFYGYCPHEKLFIKIFIYNPQHISKLAALILNGSIQV